MNFIVPEDVQSPDFIGPLKIGAEMAFHNLRFSLELCGCLDCSAIISDFINLAP